MRRYPLAILLFLLCFIVLTTSAFPKSFKKTRTEDIREDSRGQYEFGVMYLEGKGVKQDYTQAQTWFDKAATLSDSRAQYELGAMYARGKGVKEDRAQAIAWFEKAAAQGHAEAKRKLYILKGR
jgi:TPR repeat protein